MNDTIHFSTLLAEGEILLEQLRSKRPSRLTTPNQRRDFNQRYTTWYEESLAALPDDLRTRFVNQRINFSPMPDPNDQSAWSYYNSLQFALEDQQKQLFIARRRVWQLTSSVPDVCSAIAMVCRTAYAISTIESLFIDSGCEQHWYIPHTSQDTGAKAMNTALGWLDGILLYAPEQEHTILRRLCAVILANPRLKDEHRERIENVLPRFQAPAPIDTLAPYNLHPTVHHTAAPLVAIAHYDEAILKVCIALNNAVQQRANRFDLDGSSLMQQVFSPKTPLVTVSSEPTEQQGWMQLFTGAIQALRNPRAHKLGHATSLEETIEWLTFLSALFRTLDRALPSSPDQNR